MKEVITKIFGEERILIGGLAGLAFIILLILIGFSGGLIVGFIKGWKHRDQQQAKQFDFENQPPRSHIYPERFIEL